MRLAFMPSAIYAASILWLSQQKEGSMSATAGESTPRPPIPSPSPTHAWSPVAAEPSRAFVCVSAPQGSRNDRREWRGGEPTAACLLLKALFEAPSYSTT